MPTGPDVGDWAPDELDRMDTYDTTSFLTRGIWSAASDMHIRVVMGADKRNGYTTIPVQFDDPLRPSTVLLYFTDSRGRWKQESRPLRHVSPSPPKKKGESLMILRGIHEGHVYQTVQVSRNLKIAHFNLEGQNWQEAFEDLCVVEDHMISGCACQKVQ